MKIKAIITAGGIGSRLPGNTKKQFIELKGKPILFHTLERFLNVGEISDIIIVAPAEDVQALKQRIRAEYPKYSIKIVAGGNERQDSVLEGLKACRNCDYVFIHDGVRPFVTPKEIIELFLLCKRHKAVIPVYPAQHTMKRVDGDKVTQTVPRDTIYEVYTPQVFDFKLIYDLHKKAHNEQFYGTDDASICEYYNVPVYTKLSTKKNMKITEPFDLEIASLILEEMK